MSTMHSVRAAILKEVQLFHSFLIQEVQTLIRPAMQESLLFKLLQ